MKTKTEVLLHILQEQLALDNGDATYISMIYNVLSEEEVADMTQTNEFFMDEE